MSLSTTASSSRLLFTVILLGYGYYNYRHPKTNIVNIALNKPLSSDRQPIKIVAVSDLHLGNGTGKTALKRYVKMINEQNPDLILIGGDLIDNSVVPLYAENMMEELSELKHRYALLVPVITNISVA